MIFGTPIPKEDTGLTFGITLTAASWAFFVASGIGLLWTIITTFNDYSYSKSQLNVEFKIEDIKETTVRIPKGAKIKLLKAVKSKIFDEFVIAYPKFAKTIKHIYPDPAILGKTTDGRMYMIVYWDVKKDVDKTPTAMEAYLKYKIEV